MNIQNFTRKYLPIFIFGVITLLMQGCTTTIPKIPGHYYLQRSPITIAVMPSSNKTDHPEASIVFNKSCEEALRKKGFEVISADQVVTYASSRGVLLSDVTARKASEIGRDLKADMVLYASINTWETMYIVIKSASTVAGTSRLVETSTDSLVWYYNWNFRKESGSGGNSGLIGMLVDAAVTAVLNSAFDECSNLGTQAGTVTINSIQHPGFAPLEPKLTR